MRQRTLLEHEVRIEEAMQFIVEHLDEPIDLRDLADRVCLSRFHFHRVFQALAGETVGELSRRLRLERAAKGLRETCLPITELAFEAGYATHEAFIRAFRAGFGCSPSEFRRHSMYNGLLPCPNKLHFVRPFEVRFVTYKGEIDMNVEIREVETRKAVVMTHHGHYFMIGPTFGKMGAWLKENKVEHGDFIGLYYDDPGTTPVDELRSDAGALVADDYTTDDPNVRVIDVEGGRYAVGVHYGAYDKMGESWGKLMGEWLPASGEEIDSKTSFEIYVKDCDVEGMDKAITELYMGIK